MIEIINMWGTAWLRFFLVFEIQNTVFIIFILALLTIFKNYHARFKKQLTVVALIKTLIPPILFIPSVPLIADISESPLTMPFVSPSIPAATLSSHVHLSFAGALFIVWIVGLILVLLFMLRGFFKLRRQVLESDELKLDRSEINGRIKIFQHPDIISPTVFGLFSPKIILPGNWDRFSERMKDSVLQHEINHVRNGDLYLNGFKLLSILLHFMNPFQWILLHYLTLFTEMSCDDQTIREIKLSPEEYNNFILKVAEMMTIPVFSSRTWGFSRTFRLLEQRISYQLKRKEKNKMRESKLLRFAVFSFLILAMIPLSWQCSTEQKENTIPTNSIVSEQARQPQNIVDKNGVYAFFAVDKKPQMLKKARPVYPEKARRAGIEGLVIITVTIDKNGKVIEAVPFKKPIPVIDSKGKVKEMRVWQGFPELEPAAIEAAKKCLFKPAEKNGHPVKVKMNIPFRFRLNR